MKKYIISFISLILFLQINFSFADYYKPQIGDNMLIQLQGEINTSFNVGIYDIDLFDTEKTFIDKLHKEGKKVICYFSAGTYENWRDDANDFSKEVLGNDLDNWPGEKWLDTSNYQKFEEIIKKRLDLAKEKGCDGVDPDNVDGGENNSGFKISKEDTINYLKFLSIEAHNRGLSIGLKNALIYIERLVNDFDFAINESCYHYNECYYLEPFINNNKPVFGIEYKKNKSSFCDKAIESKFSFVKDNYDLNGKKTDFCNDLNTKENTLLDENTKIHLDNIFNKIKNLKTTNKKNIINKYISLVNNGKTKKAYLKHLQFKAKIDYIEKKIKEVNL